jgi:hypothetical protein
VASWAILGVPSTGLAQDDAPPAEGAIFLLLPTDAKAVGLGRAVTALPGAESVWWNPAGLAELEEDRLLVFRAENVGGEATAASLTLARPGLGALGMSYQLLDFGSISQTDEQGNVTGTVTLRQHLGVLSMATELWERLSVGLNVKLVQDRFSCRGQCVDAGVTATTFALDAGVQAHDIGGHPVRLGALLAHAGPDLQVRNEAQADPLPTRIRVAAAYEVLGRFVDAEELDLWLTLELDDRWRDPGDPGTYTGAEFVAGGGRQELRLRAGYVLNADAQVDGGAVGLGLRYESFDLAIAKSLASSIVAGETEPVHVSFGFVF